MSRLPGIAAALAVVALTGAPASATGAPGHHAALDFVRATGGPFMLDGQGRRLEFHGVNLVAKCGADTHPAKAPGTPCIPGGRAAENYVLAANARDRGRRFTSRDAATLHRLGFTLVRLGIIWDGLEPGPRGVGKNDAGYCATHLPGTPYPNLGKRDPYDGRVARAYLSRVDRVVRLLSAQHIRVLIDMHQDGWGRPFANPKAAAPWMSEGAPDWATCTSSAPFDKPATWQGTYTDPAVNAALQHFWQNDVAVNLQGQFQRVWRAVAGHFARNPNVIGYDLFNEPSGPEAATPQFDRQLQCFYAGSSYAPASCSSTGSQAPATGLIPAVQAVAPRQIAFYEAPVLSDFGAPQTVGTVEKLPFGRVGISFHDYGGVPGQSTFECTASTCGTQEDQSMARFAEERPATQTAQPGGPTWLMSEFGAENYAPDIAHVAKLGDENLVSWTYWAALQLHDPTGGPGEGLLGERSRRPDRARARVLARVYPLATAGTPKSQSFDPVAETFSFSYAPDPKVHAPTLVSIPLGYHYRYGYSVRTSGARVTSRRNAGVLGLRNRPGAKTVTVQVRPRPRPRHHA